MKIGAVSKKDLLIFLNGHTQANILIEEERSKRLPQLSIKESLLEYEALCEFWESSLAKETSEDFEKQKISFLVKRRELLNRVRGYKK